ncbi:MAG: hypothetical protein A3G81_08485 [Betaproteobacteria bacterium RIFCSPLOWO2_12_FULL_65_14]|nr:MAG: hypothetical protein A3G81_08485 [Betaproteobacteria bacterium RIFCSPLOWO2_12_FULL_65_14]
MTGSALLGLVLLSMAWLFFLLGLAVNYRLLHPQVTLGFLPGVVGSLAVFFTIPALGKHGIDVPWPWLWILLPLALDPGGVGGLVLRRFQKR